MADQIIIGITGTNGSGKTSVVRYLVKNHNFRHFSMGGYIAAELVKQDTAINRDSLINMANSLREKYGPNYIAKTLGKKVEKYGGNAVIESLRNSAEVETLRKFDNFYLLAIDADPKTRYQRVIKRKSTKDRVSFEKFVKTEKREMHTAKKHEENMARCIEMAGYKIINSGTLKELHKKIEEVLGKINYS